MAAGKVHAVGPAPQLGAGLEPADPVVPGVESSRPAIAQRLVITERSVAKHTASTFLRLGLQPSDDDNRRVLEASPAERDLPHPELRCSPG